MNKSFEVQGAEISVLSLEDKDYISSVILKDDTVTTPEGLAIGQDPCYTGLKYIPSNHTDGNTHQPVPQQPVPQKHW